MLRPKRRNSLTKSRLQNEHLIIVFGCSSGPEYCKPKEAICCPEVSSAPGPQSIQKWWLWTKPVEPTRASTVQAELQQLWPVCAWDPWKLKQVWHLHGSYCWEKLNRGGSKPGGFPLFSGKVLIVLRTFSELFRVGAVNRPRKRKRTNRENPRRVPELIRKIPEKSGKSQKGQKRTKKEGQVQIGKPPRLNPPV